MVFRIYLLLVIFFGRQEIIIHHYSGHFELIQEAFSLVIAADSIFVEITICLNYYRIIVFIIIIIIIITVELVSVLFDSKSSKPVGCKNKLTRAAIRKCSDGLMLLDYH